MSHAAIREIAPPRPPYQRHRPEQTLLYQIIGRYYPEFRDVIAAQGKLLPFHVQKEFAESSLVGLNMVFYECNVPNAIMNTWSRSVVSGAGFVQAVEQDEWRKALRC